MVQDSGSITYLAPIYSSEARFVIPLLSKSYPKKIWTKFESDNFKQRFGENSVIPIWFSDAPLGIFDESRKYGGLTLDSSANIENQVNLIVESLVLKISEARQEESGYDK